MTEQSEEFLVKEAQAGIRLDSCITSLEEFSHLSRSRIQELITSGHIQVNGLPRKKGYLVHTGDRISVSLPSPRQSLPQPEPLPLDILHEDKDIIVLVKPAGLVVHPAAGNEEGTLVNALLYHCASIREACDDPLRPGIVHRLDKDTSGVMVAAKHEQARLEMVNQFKNREVEKIYHAVLTGVPEGEGTVSRDLGRHPVHRKKRAVLTQGGKNAVTHWQIQEIFSGLCLVRIRLDTGRTHQIRVHMASLHCPVAGDALYGRKKTGSQLTPPRLCLHASTLSFRHPFDGKEMSFTAPLPADIQQFLENLRKRS